MSSYMYSVGRHECDHEPACRFDVPVTWAALGRKICRDDIGELADDYYSEHDGWEDTWPLEFRVYDDSGAEVGRWSVSQEYSPSFVVTTVANPIERRQG